MPDPISMSTVLPMLGAGLGAASSGGGSQTTTTTPWSEQQPYLQDLFQRAQQYSQGPAFPDFQTYAGFTEPQIQAQQGLLGYAGGGLQNLIGQTQQGLAGMLSATPNMDVWGPAMQEAARIPTRTYQETILPSIRSGAQAAGQYGSSRQGIAEGIAGRGLTEALASQQTGLAQMAASEALNQRMAGMGMAGQIANLGMSPYNIMGQVGGQQQAMEQQGINQALQQFYAPLQQLQNYQGLVTGNYGGTQTTPYQGNPLLGGLAGMYLGGMFGGLNTAPGGYATTTPGMGGYINNVYLD